MFAFEHSLRLRDSVMMLTTLPVHQVWPEQRAASTTHHNQNSTYVSRTYLDMMTNSDDDGHVDDNDRDEKT